MANVPDPSRSTICNWLLVVGFTNANVPDPTGQCCITVRDFANNPIANSRVEIDLSACCDINICNAVIAGQDFKSCVPPVISGRTNNAGVICVTVTGAAKNTGASVPPAIFPGAGLGCAVVRAGPANGATATVTLGRPTAVAFDQDGSTNAGGTNGVNSLDLAKVKNDIGAVVGGAAYKGRSDYNCDAALNSLDLSFCKTEIGRAVAGTGSVSTCGIGGSTYCKTKAPGC